MESLQPPQNTFKEGSTVPPRTGKLHASLPAEQTAPSAKAIMDRIDSFREEGGVFGTQYIEDLSKAPSPTLQPLS